MRFNPLPETLHAARELNGGSTEKSRKLLVEATATPLRPVIPPEFGELEDALYIYISLRMHA